MNSTTITALLNVVEALIPTITAGASTLFADVKTILADVQGSPNVTDDQLTQAQALNAASDAAQDAAYKAYQAQDAGNGEQDT